MQGDYHIGWSTDELAPVIPWPASPMTVLRHGRSSNTGDLGTMLADWGSDVNFLIDANLCKDEFSDCRTLSDFNADAYYWRYPDRTAISRFISCSSRKARDAA